MLIGARTRQKLEQSL